MSSSEEVGGFLWHRRNASVKKGKRFLIIDDDDEDSEDVMMVEADVNLGKSEDGQSEKDDAGDQKPIPTGNAFRVPGSTVLEDRTGFEFVGESYKLEDPVLLSPENNRMKPYVAIIKGITHNTSTGEVNLNGQRLYRPEEAEKKGGGTWEACDSRELFYSFDRMIFIAERIMHTCVMNFVPLHKQLPNRMQFPGYVIQKVYDTDLKKVFDLTDKSFDATKRAELDRLLYETRGRIGDLPDLNVEDSHFTKTEELAKGKGILREGNSSPIGESKKDEGTYKYHSILMSFHALTRDIKRNTWLEKLLQSVEKVCTSSDAMQKMKEAGTTGYILQAGNQIVWPHSAVSAVTTLEKASNKEFSENFPKYNQKMRQLVTNLKNNAFLAQRLLRKELKPSVLLQMSPEELKEGLTSEEIARNKPEKSKEKIIQMTDAKCKSCTMRNVGVVDIFLAGYSSRYELQCLACKDSWVISQETYALIARKSTE